MSKTKTVVAINGDGIGREIVTAARRVVDAAVAKDNIKIEWIEQKAGGEAIDAYGEPLPADTIKACEAAHAVLLGAVGGPQWDDGHRPFAPRKRFLVFVKLWASFAIFALSVSLKPCRNIHHSNRNSYRM